MSRLQLGLQRRGQFRLGLSGGNPLGLRGDAFGSFASMANGAPTTAATGQAFLRVADNGAGIVQAMVSGGVLVAADSGFAATAAYTGFKLREDIKSMYCDASLGDANDNVTLIACADMSVAEIAYSSIHVYFTPTVWALQYWSNSVLTTLFSGNYVWPTNTRCRVGWRINGANMYILQPDGVEVGPFSVAAIASRTNHVAIYEHYRFAAGAPGSKFYAVSANLFANPTAAGRTNIITQINNIANAAWTKGQIGTITSGQADADGGTLGEKMLEDTSNSVHLVYQANLAKAAVAKRYTARAKVKPVGRDWFQMIVYDSVFADNAGAYFNVTTGAIGTVNGTFLPVASIFPLGNGYYQVEMEFTSDTDVVIQPLFQTASADGVNAFVGDVLKGCIIYDEWLFERPT